MKVKLIMFGLEKEVDLGDDSEYDVSQAMYLTISMPVPRVRAAFSIGQSNTDTLEGIFERLPGFSEETPTFCLLRTRVAGGVEA